MRPARREPAQTKSAAVYSELLAGFQLRRARVSAAAADLDDLSVQSCRDLLGGFRDVAESWRSRQRTTADDFNILGVLQLTQNELRHSMMLAWLLDRDLSHLGTHAQGNLGLALLLAELGLPSSYASEPYWVRREVRGSESRVDIEVAARGAFLLQFENKIRSGEGVAQTAREAVDLRRRASELGIAGDHVHAIFLTPDGRPASSPDFVPVSWAAVARVLDKFGAVAVPPDVALFCRHYARTIRTYVVFDRHQKEAADG